MPRPVLAGIALAFSLVVVACSADEASVETSTTSSTAAPATSAPADGAPGGSSEVIEVIELMTTRLSDEFGDPDVARAVVANLDPTIVTRFEQVAPPEEIATAPILSYRADPYLGPVDQLVVLSFGNRVAEDGTVSPGPTNEALADAVQAYVAQNPVPVYAQWEVAQLLQARGVPDVVSIEPEVGSDGQQVYLSTSGVTDQIVARAAADGVELGTVGMVCHADHLVRCIMTAEGSGMTTVVPVDGIELPTAYDPESGQEWTRDRTTYLSVDLSGRLATL